MSLKEMCVFFYSKIISNDLFIEERHKTLIRKRLQNETTTVIFHLS